MLHASVYVLAGALATALVSLVIVTVATGSAAAVSVRLPDLCYFIAGGLVGVAVPASRMGGAGS